MLAVFSGYIIIAAATMMHPLNCISSYYCGLRFTTNQSHKCFEVTVYLEQIEPFNKFSQFVCKNCSAAPDILQSRFFCL